MIRDSDDLDRGVWGIPGRGRLDGAFNLTDECLNGKVGAVRRAKFDVVVLQVGGRNVRGGCV